MFVFAKSVKELLITSGVAISSFLFFALAIVAISRGIWGIVFALFPLLLVATVLRGNKLGYLATRIIWNAIVFLVLLGCVLNPFAWSDSLIEGFGMVGRGLVALPLALCFSYCLSEHAKLRKLEGAERWRNFPISPKLILILLGLGAAGFVGLWVLVTGTSKEKLTAVHIGVLKSKLATYKQLNGVYPAPEQGLPFESSGGGRRDSELQRISDYKDVWNTPFIYRYPGKRHPDSFDLFSAGPDRTPDTADDVWGE
jgi:hypothetical protein